MGNSSFTIGNVNAGRDVNVDSSVNNSITISYSTIAKELQSIAETLPDKEEKVVVKELSEAVETTNKSTILKVLDSIADNAPLISKICTSLFKIIV